MDKTNYSRSVYQKELRNEKRHYKMYKEGKKWIFAGVSVLGLAATGLFATVDVVAKADADVATSTGSSAVPSPTAVLSSGTPVTTDANHSGVSDTSSTDAVSNQGTEDSSAAIVGQNTQSDSSSVSDDSTSANHDAVSTVNKHAIQARAMAVAAPSDEKVVASGMNGTSQWTLDSDGVLTVGAGNLAGIQAALPGLNSGSDAKVSYWVTPDTQNKIKTINIQPGVVAPIDSEFLFSDLPNLTTINGLSNLNLSNATTIASMFIKDTSLTSVDFTGLDTSKVKYFSNMFNGDTALVSANMGKLNTSSLLATNNMFKGATSLTNVNVAGWDTSKVTTMNSMFAFDTSLTSLDLSSFDSSSVTNADSALEGLKSLTQITVGPKLVNFGKAALDSPEDKKNSTVGSTNYVSTGSWQAIDSAKGGSELDPRGAAGDGQYVITTGVATPTTYVIQKDILATIHFVDQNGKSLSDDVVVQGLPGASIEAGTLPTSTTEHVVDDGTVDATYKVGSANEYTVKYAQNVAQLKGDQTITYNGKKGTLDVKNYQVTLANKQTYTLVDGDLAIVDADSAVGTYHVKLTQQGLDHINALDANHQYVSGDDVNFVINKCPITVTAPTLTKTEDGAPYTGSVTGKVTGQPADGEAVKYTLSDVSKDTEAGRYAIKVNVGDNPNYDVTVVDGSLTIQPISKGTIVVHYVSGGKEIQQSVTLVGKTGDMYMIQKLAINGYTFESASDGLSGKYGTGSRDIYLNYTADSAATSGRVAPDQKTAGVTRKETQRAKMLPKTGESQSAGLVAVGLGLMSLLGLSGYKRRH